LRYHLLKHKGEKVFKCTFPGCPKSFLTYAQLKQHEKAAYYHQKVTVSHSPMNQSSPVQLSIQNSDEIGSFEDEKNFGIDSVDGIDSSEFTDLDINFEEMLNNQFGNESLNNTLDHLESKSGHLDGKYREVSTAPTSSTVSETSSAGNQSKRKF